jgi:hypothetical protein
VAVQVVAARLVARAKAGVALAAFCMGQATQFPDHLFTLSLSARAELVQAHKEAMEQFHHLPRFLQTAAVVVAAILRLLAKMVALAVALHMIAQLSELARRAKEMTAGLALPLQTLAAVVVAARAA